MRTTDSHKPSRTRKISYNLEKVRERERREREKEGEDT